MNLYEITSRYEQAFLQMADMDDLPQEVIDNTLEGIEGELNAKAIAVAAYIENLRADAEAIDSAIKRMKERMISRKNKVEALTKYLLTSMQRVGINKISSPELELAIKKNPPKVVIDNEAALPREFIKISVVENVDKKAIAEALKSGEVIEGAHIEQGFRLAIS